MSQVELETVDGEILTFDTERQRNEYVISRMIERGQIVAAGRDPEGEIIVRLPGNRWKG